MFLNMELMNIFGPGFDVDVIRIVIYVLINLIGSAILLHLGTGLLGFDKKGFTRAFTVVIIGDIVLFALSFYPFGTVIGFLVFLYLIKKFYDVGWILAFLAFLMSIVVAVVITIILLLILGISVFIIPAI